MGSFRLPTLGLSRVAIAKHRLILYCRFRLINMFFQYVATRHSFLPFRCYLLFSVRLFLAQTKFGSFNCRNVMGRLHTNTCYLTLFSTRQVNWFMHRYSPLLDRENRNGTSVGDRKFINVNCSEFINTFPFFSQLKVKHLRHIKLFIC